MGVMESNLMVLFGGLISGLLSVVAYFVRQLHADFRKMESDLGEVKTNVSLIKSEFKGGHDLQGQRIYFLEQRIDKLESRIID
jgi:hypothetical protein